MAEKLSSEQQRPRVDLWPAIEMLRRAGVGKILAAGDAGYDKARSVRNATIDRRPAVIDPCKGAADIVGAVRFAPEQKPPVSIRGGARNVAGRRACDGGLMIDRSPMRGVRVDPERRRSPGEVRARSGSGLALL